MPIELGMLEDVTPEVLAEKLDLPDDWYIRRHPEKYFVAGVKCNVEGFDTPFTCAGVEFDVEREAWKVLFDDDSWSWLKVVTLA